MAKKNAVSNYSYRSGVETAWRCPRSGYLEQFYLGTGIVKKPRAYWLDVGIAVHAGLAVMMEVGMRGHYEGNEAARVAVEYWDTCGQKGILHDTTFNEQRILIEALLWAFYYHSLKAFLETYEILYVEQEVTEIVKGRPRYLMMSRPDAIVRDRSTGELVVISWKTIDDPNEWRRLFFKQDLQGMMEAWYSEQFLATEGRTKAQHRLGGWEPKISYVQTIYLVKGKRAKLKDAAGGWDNSEEYAEGMFADTEGPQWRTDSHLVYPYTNLTKKSTCPVCSGGKRIAIGMGLNDCYECKGEGTVDNPFESLSWKWKYTKPGNVTQSTLGAAYKRVLVTDTSMSVQEYVKALSLGEIFPSTTGNEPFSALEKTVVWERPSYRDAGMMQSMIEQVKETERKRHRDKKVLDRALPIGDYGAVLYNMARQAEPPDHGKWSTTLDKLFPQQLTSCSFPWRCQFADVVNGPCHSEKGRSAIHTLKMPEGYEERQPHHEQEAEYRRSLVQIEEMKG